MFIERPDNGCIHFENHFALAEIEAEARAAGLDVASHEQSSDGNIALVAPARAT